MTVTGRLSTGIEELDRQLNGGFHPGTVVAVCAPADSQSEPLIHATMRERPTRYVSTRRGEAAVRDSLDRAFPNDEANYTVRIVGPSDPQETVREAVDVPENGAIVIDAIDPLEHAAEGDDLAAFLNDLKEAAIEAQGVALIHCASGHDGTANRSLTEAFADVIWNLTVERNGSQVEHVLQVPKFRGDDLPGEAIKLELGREVSVDTSRDIA